MLKKKLSTIGSSTGLIIEKPLLDLYGFEKEVEITPVEGGLLIKPARESIKRADDEKVKAARAKINARYGKALKDLA